MHETVVISCIFGDKFSAVHHAPLKADCFLFTNNTNLKDEIEDKNWIYVYVKSEISDDYVISSLQSKYVKFLQFLRHERYRKLFECYDKIIYVDHKNILKRSHIQRLEAINDKPVLLRYAPTLKNTIWKEVKEASGQERYMRFEERTVDYIREKIKDGYREDVIICNTGLILYHIQNDKVIELANEVHEDMINIGNPECQIFWAMISQRYEKIIQEIPFDLIPIEWKTPIKPTRINRWIHKIGSSLFHS